MSDLLSAFPGRHCEPAPVPLAYAEPVERLLQAFRPGQVAFLLSVTRLEAAEWLTARRIESHLQNTLMEPVVTGVWPLLADVWAISLSIPGGTQDAVSGLHIHTFRAAFLSRLECAWRNSVEVAVNPACALELQAEGLSSPPLGLTDDNLNPPAFSLSAVSLMSAGEDIQGNIAELNGLLEILVNKRLYAQFQPIISLRDGQTVGHEALIRGPKGAPLRRPGALFHAADKARMVSWFDIACQEQCFAGAAEQGLKHLLFVNMDAEGLAFLNGQQRSLAERAREHGLSPSSIVVEITERQAVDDFPRLVRDIERLREEGFRIAIDDAGAGYSSLQVIAEIRPEFVKIDRSLVSNLDVNGEKRALLTALSQYARQIGTSLLAEGFETRGELCALIDLGIPYGQGYFAGKPADALRGIPRDTRAFIQQYRRTHDRLQVGIAPTVGEIARAGLAMDEETPLALAAERFARNPSLTSIVILQDDRVRGLLMREQLEHVLNIAKAARVGELLPSETVGRWMRTNLLLADAGEPVIEVARRATTRTDVRLEADIVVVRDPLQYVGVIPARILLESSAGLARQSDRHSDPLTGMPGRVAFEQVWDERIADRRSAAAVRIDLSRLEQFNRESGIEAGDAAILGLADLLRRTTAELGDGEELTAHFGGDDFVILTTPEAADGICRAILAGWKRSAAASATRGGDVVEEDASGLINTDLWPAVTVVTIAARANKFTRFPQIWAQIERLLQEAKARPTNGSTAGLLAGRPDERARRVA